MSVEKLAALTKRNRQLQAIVQQRELTQVERDEWEELVRQMNDLQESAHPEQSE
jgi:hypothetical protein